MKQFLQLRNRTSFYENWSQRTPKNVLNKQSRFLCTISGGQDSVLSFFVLLHSFDLLSKDQYFISKRLIVPKLPRDPRNLIFETGQDQTQAFRVQDFSSEKRNKVKVLYCHHFWQRKNFFSSFFIFRLTFIFRVPYIFILPQISVLTENNSRGWRKKNFCRVSQVARSVTVLTGHTETDRLEKNLNNLFRGTSSKGFNDLTLLNYKKLQNLGFSVLITKSKNFIDLTRFLKKTTLFAKKYFLNTKFIPLLKPRFYRSVPLRTHQPKNFFLEHQTSPRVKQKFRFFITKKVDSFSFRGATFTNENYLGGKSAYSVSFCFYSKSVYSKSISWRPLQNTRRFTVSQLIYFYQFPLLTDFTNFSCRFSRNKIRHHFLPFIRTLFHKKIESLLLNCFQTIGKEREEIEKKLIEFWFLRHFFDSKSLKKRIRPFKKDKLTAHLLGTTYYENLQGQILQQIIYDYRTIELSFLQISHMKSQTLI